MSTPNRPDLEPADDPMIETKLIEIDGMRSLQCAHAIETALRKTDGVQRAEVDLDRELLTVIFDTRKTHVPALHDVILKTGYRPARNAD